MKNEEIENLIKKIYNKYNGGYEDSYDQALEVGCYDEIIMMREFAKEILILERNKEGEDSKFIEPKDIKQDNGFYWEKDVDQMITDLKYVIYKVNNPACSDYANGNYLEERFEEITGTKCLKDFD